MERNIILETLARKGGLKNAAVKLAVSLGCLVVYVFHVGFYRGCPWQNHLVYTFCHANVFHLAVNLTVLWNIKNRLRPLQAFAIAVLVSFLPMYVHEPTMGLSGFLFASFGLMWGCTGRHKDAFVKVMPFVVCTMLIPGVNGLLHFYAFVLGFIVQYIITKATAHHE